VDLYKELILEHSKAPHGAGLREPFAAQVHHINTTCGDEVTLRVALTDDAGARVLSDVSYDAMGCAISMASTSMLHDLVSGRPLAEAQRAFDAMRAMLTSRGEDGGDEELLGDGIALSGVSRYPARVKCALLGWMALQDALTQAVDSDDAGDRTETKENAR
jgi:nitrogen fixation NifU-like protein